MSPRPHISKKTTVTYVYQIKQNTYENNFFFKGRSLKIYVKLFFLVNKNLGFYKMGRNLKILGHPLTQIKSGKRRKRNEFRTF